jgi:hypothetical protein
MFSKAYPGVAWNEDNRAGLRYLHLIAEGYSACSAKYKEQLVSMRMSVCRNSISRRHVLGHYGHAIRTAVSGIDFDREGHARSCSKLSPFTFAGGQDQWSGISGWRCLFNRNESRRESAAKHYR